VKFLVRRIFLLIRNQLNKLIILVALPVMIEVEIGMTGVTVAVAEVTVMTGEVMPLVKTAEMLANSADQVAAVEPGLERSSKL
jgi:hypothetical protein